jgi:RNA polymerase sigma factor (sigma-70 family)
MSTAVIHNDSLLGSVSVWIHDLKAGSEAAATALFKRYFSSIRNVARRELKGFPTRILDDEDLAIDVIDGLFCAMREGRFRGLKDREHMWALMVLFTRQVTVNHKRWETREKRDIQKVDDSDFELATERTTPEHLVAAKDQQQRLFDILRTDELRIIAAAKLEGYSNAEIAERLKLSSRSIQRKVNRIYDRWEQEMG